MKRKPKPERRVADRRSKTHNGRRTADANVEERNIRVNRIIKFYKTQKRSTKVTS